MSSTNQSKYALGQEEIGIIKSHVINTRKYKEIRLPEKTIENLIQSNSGFAKNIKELEKIVKQKLHNIVAPYLEVIDYPMAIAELITLDPKNEVEIKLFCQKLMQQHASTRERIPILEDFYCRIFEVTGVPNSILDMACGLNPFAIPWMHLPLSTNYYAYDLHEPRITLINEYFRLINFPQLAEKRDILVDPPNVQADVAFFFKEAHRFEQRQHGCNRAFWEAIRVRYLLVSLPASNLTGSRNMANGQRILVERTIRGLPWSVQEINFDSEIIFCIDKGL